jgi:hypothetical protein
MQNVREQFEQILMKSKERLSDIGNGVLSIYVIVFFESLETFSGVPSKTI